MYTHICFTLCFIFYQPTSLVLLMSGDVTADTVSQPALGVTLRLRDIVEIIVMRSDVPTVVHVEENSSDVITRYVRPSDKVQWDY